MKILTSLLYLVWIALGTIQVQGQPNPKEILEKAGEACLQVRNIRYTIFAKKRGGIVEEASIVQEKANVPAIVMNQKIRIKIQGKVSFPDKAKNHRFAVAYDGHKIYRQVSTKKRLLEMKNPTPKQAMRTLGINYLMLPVFQFGQKKPFKNVIPHVKKFERLEDKNIQGVTCYQIRLHQEIMGRSSKVTWFIGKQDYLPRGFLLPHLQISKEIKILAVNAQLLPDTFVIPLPKGYTRKVVTAKEKSLLAKGEKAPDWTLKAPDGKLVSLSDFKGKVVLLDFWGTWCAPCLRAMPTIQTLHNKYKSQGLEVVGVSVKDRPGAPEAYMKKKGYTYQLVLQGIKVARQYQVALYPSVYVIDRKGNISFAKSGATKKLKTILEMAIEKVIR